MEKPIYTQKPIASIDSLATALSCSSAELLQLSDKVESFYYRKFEVDRKGKPREYWVPFGRLKVIQGRIRRALIDKVWFPPYLQGSIRDAALPRSYVANATMHVGQQVLIGLDIEDFFPSTSAEFIQAVWQYFFCFPPHVANVLTRLTTLQGSLPVGASTSPGLANLVFFDREPQLEAELRTQGFRYSRYVDDLSVSASRKVTRFELQRVFSSVFGMFASKGLSPNREKISITPKGLAQRVHGLNVDGQYPTLRRIVRARIRTAVRECVTYLPEQRGSAEYYALWQRTSGRVEMMAVFHPHQAARYQRQLSLVRPQQRRR